MKEEVIIIGAGIAGLTAAYLLNKEGQNPLVLESSDRLGGRIYTKAADNMSYELGATWVFQDSVLKGLIAELQLTLYTQYLKGDALIKYDPSMAIQRSPTDSLMNGAIYHKVLGGTGAIIQALTDQLDTDRILLKKKVVSLNYENEHIAITLADNTTFVGKKVIVAVPPKTISEHIKMTPLLNDHQIMKSTHTWMGDSAKFTVLVDRDFWRLNNLSGFVYSNYGLIREMQDHCSPDGKSFGLLGFLNPLVVKSFDFEKRKQAVLLELKELFGIQEANVLGYDDFLWDIHFQDQHDQNYNTSLMPHQNNGHSFYLQSHFDHRLFFAGAETSPMNPGYMEGAVSSAYRIVNLLLN